VLVVWLFGLAAGVAFAGVGPRLARRLPPRTAAVLLVGGGLLTTAALVGAVALLASTAVARVPVFASAGDWSPRMLRATAPVPTWVALCCLVLLLAVTAAGIRAGVSRVRDMLPLHRACQGLEAASAVLVLDSDVPEAFATPAGGGRVVVTTGMLRGLRPDEIPALLAHERSHLRHRHVWWVLVMQLCGVVNPALRGVVGAAIHAVERWADEDAAAEVGDRRLVARAVARAALHVRNTVGSRPVGAQAGCGAVDGDVLARVRSLLDGPPRRHVTAALALVTLTLLSVAGAAGVQDRTDDFFDAAQTHATTAMLYTL
jgi:hypothetical protein